MSDLRDHLYSLDESLLPKEFKGEIYRYIAWGTLFITIVYSILNIIIGDSMMIVLFHIFYMITACIVLLSLSKKRYRTAEMSIVILFPLCFLGSSISLGEAYHSEYYIFITAIGSVFIFQNNKVISLLTGYNTFIFGIIKIHYHYYPGSLFEMKQGLLAQHLFSACNGIFVFSFLLFITFVILKRYRSLYSILSLTQQNQDKIILERTNELKNAYEEISRFTHISAHDLREPLRNIMSFSQLLEKNVSLGKKENNEEFIGFIKKNIKRIDTITKDVVYYTDIDNRSKRLEIIDTKEIVQDILNYYEKDININLSYSNLPQLKMNRNLCYDLFSQLIENAITYSEKEEKRVVINCVSNEKEYLFSVKDNGNGIPKEFIDSTFVMFKRLHNNLDHKGSGMGLSLCKKIVSAYKGRIWVESDIGLGSIFYFTIPMLATVPNFQLEG